MGGTLARGMDQIGISIPLPPKRSIEPPTKETSNVAYPGTAAQCALIVNRKENRFLSLSLSPSLPISQIRFESREPSLRDRDHATAAAFFARPVSPTGACGCQNHCRYCSQLTKRGTCQPNRLGRGGWQRWSRSRRSSGRRQAGGKNGR